MRVARDLHRRAEASSSPWPEFAGRSWREAAAQMGAVLSSVGSRRQSGEKRGDSEPDCSRKPRMRHPRLIAGLPDEISLQILARVPRIGYLNAKRVSRSWKAAITGAELYRLRKELGVDEEWLYILAKARCGKLVWHAFDPLSNQWQRLPLMPGITHGEDCKRGIPGLRVGDFVGAGVMISDVIRGWLGQKDFLDRIPFCGCAIGTVDGCLYVLGGFSRASALGLVWRYDPVINLWQEVSSMSTGRAFCKTGMLNNKMYVVGGVRRGKNGLDPLQSAEVFDPATGIWAEVPNMPFSKAPALPTTFLAELLKPVATGMTSYGGKLYVPQSLYSWPCFVDVGGEIFDPSTNSWSQMPVGLGRDWPARQSGTKLSAVVNGELYALEPPTSSDRGKIKMYDPQDDTWKVAVSQVPVGEFIESECPYLLSAFLGKLHLITKDVDNKISIMQTDALKPMDSAVLAASSTCQNLRVSSEHKMDIWKVVGSKTFAATEIVSCQALSI